MEIAWADAQRLAIVLADPLLPKQGVAGSRLISRSMLRLGV